MNIAIITGASSGLGREFALQLCHNYAAEIDEIWLLAKTKRTIAYSGTGNICHWNLRWCCHANGHYR